MSDSLKVNTAATNENESGTAEVKDVTTNGNIADVKGETDNEEIKIVAAAGIETKIENYESKRTQRRHFSEADEVMDVTDNENTADSEGAVEIDEVEEAAVIEREKIETEEAAVIEKKKIETKEAAVIERKKVESYEGVLSQRKHFPGSTTSNIFR